MSPILLTVAETPLFRRLAKDVWDESEREAFVNYIARHPEEGDVIPDTGSVRKLRWAAREAANGAARA